MVRDNGREGGGRKGTRAHRRPPDAPADYGYTRAHRLSRSAASLRSRVGMRPSHEKALLTQRVIAPAASQQSWGKIARENARDLVRVSRHSDARKAFTRLKKNQLEIRRGTGRRFQLMTNRRFVVSKGHNLPFASTRASTRPAPRLPRDSARPPACPTCASTPPSTSRRHPRTSCCCATRTSSKACSRP